MVQRSQKLNFAPPTQSKKLCNAFYLTLLYSSLLVPLEVGRTIRFLPRETLDPFLRFYAFCLKSNLGQGHIEEWTVVIKKNSHQDPNPTFYKMFGSAD